MENGRYSRTICLSRLENITRDNPSFISQNPSLFFSNSTELPQLTLHGCEQLCGSRWGEYPDFAGRLLNYIIPLLLLLVNLSYATIGLKRFLLVFRVLGDPIGCIWWHLATLRIWVDSRREALKFISAIDNAQTKAEVLDPITLLYFIAARQIRSAELADAFKTALKGIHDFERPLAEREASFRSLLRTASTLASSRVVDIRRAVFAVLVYMVQAVVAVFAPTVWGVATASGGRLSPAALLSWMLPTVLLSNAIGDSTSWKHAEDVLEGFVTEAARTGSVEKIPTGIDSANTLTRATIHPRYGVHLDISPGETSWTEALKLAIAAAFPVISGFTIASAIDLTPPTYFSCRMLFNIFALTAWCFSALITAYCVSSRVKPAGWVPLMILAKDFIVGIPIMAVVLLSTSGLFNSCYCSSGKIWRGDNARVDMKPDAVYAHNKMVYVVCVIIGLAVQVAFFAVVARAYKTVLGVIWSADNESFWALAFRHPGRFLLADRGKGKTW